MLAGLDPDSAAAACGPHESLDAPTGLVFDSVGDREGGEDDAEVGLDGLAPFIGQTQQDLPRVRLVVLAAGLGIGEASAVHSVDLSNQGGPDSLDRGSGQRSRTEMLWVLRTSFVSAPRRGGALR